VEVQDRQRRICDDGEQKRVLAWTGIDGGRGGGRLPLLKRYKGRHYSVHLKENVPSKTATLGEKPTDGGRCIPWRAVLDCLAQENVAWYVVEAEAIPDSLEPLKDSIGYLRSVGI